MKFVFHQPVSKLLALAGAFYASNSCAGESPSVEERLQQLENQVKVLVDENAALKKQLNWDGKKSLNLVEDKGKAASVALGGYLQAQAEIGDSPDQRFTGSNANDGFKVRRARINASGMFLQHFDFKIEGDFGGKGSALRAQLTDGYINWNRYDYLNIKAGQYKTHFGYEQLTPDTGGQTVERSYPTDLLTVSRQLGASATGSVLDKRLSYAAGVFNGNNANNGFNDGDNYLGTARVEGTPFKTKLGEQDVSLGLGLNGLWSHDTSVAISGFDFRTNPTGAPNNNFAGTRAGVGVDSQLVVGRFGLRAELLYVNFQPSDGNLTANPDDDNFGSLGYYITGTYDILPKKLTALLKYECVDTENDVGSNDAQSVGVGLAYYIKGTDIKLLANYLYGCMEDAGWDGRFLSQLQIVY